MRPISHVVVHHSASPLSTTAQDISEWHTANGWGGAGYHIICESTGRLVLGRRIGRIGAHVRGWNKNSIGICLVGNNTIEADSWTDAQIISLGEMYFVMRTLFPDAEWLGHRDLPGTATECPGLSVKELISQFTKRNKTRLQNV